MKSYPLLRTSTCTCVILLVLTVLAAPETGRAECKELRIVEYDDRVEAVCVGEPLTEAQKKAILEDEKRQEQEAQRRKTEEQNRQREADRVVRSKADTEAEIQRRRQSVPPAVPPKTRDKSRIMMPDF